MSNARTYAPCILDLDALGTCPSTIQRGKNDKKRRKENVFMQLILDTMMMREIEVDTKITFITILMVIIIT